MENKGLVHIYAGENSAALPTSLGMALRACGAGLRVGYFCFGEENEAVKKAVQRLSGAYFECCEKDMTALVEIVEKMADFDMVILENCCFIDADDLINFIENKPEHTELVLCGGDFLQEIYDTANLITERKVIL